MTDQTNQLFEQTPEEGVNDSSDPASSSELFTDQLKDIRNEQGEPKYKDVGSALKALKASQDFIETLKTEKAESTKRINELEQELGSRETVEQALQKLKGTQTPPATDDRQQADTLGSDDVEKLVNDVLGRQEQKRTAQVNLDRVQKHLLDSFGDSAQEKIKSKALELDMSMEDLKTLSQTKPSLVISLFGSGGTPNPQPVRSSATPARDMPQSLEMPKPKTSMMRGASREDIAEYNRQLKEYTYKSLGVET